MAKSNDRAITIRLPKSLHEELKARADEEDRTIAAVLRLAARMYLANNTSRVVLR